MNLEERQAVGQIEAAAADCTGKDADYYAQKYAWALSEGYTDISAKEYAESCLKGYTDEGMRIASLCFQKGFFGDTPEEIREALRNLGISEKILRAAYAQAAT
jgi:hypothetical protein